MLSERSQTHKAPCCGLPSLGNVQNRQPQRQKVDLGSPQAGRVGGRTANGYQVDFGGAENALELDHSGDCTTV